MIPFAAVLACLLPVHSAAGETRVELGKEFRLSVGAAARLPGKRAKLRLKSFVNSPCPEGARCVWSGQEVIYELTPKDAPYEVEVKSSDYRTYAAFVVDDPERACARRKPGARPECLRALAARRSSPALCRMIDDERTRGFCLEDLAESRKEPGLCGEVEHPSQFCLYARSKAEGNLAACDGIVLFPWRVRCFKELTGTGGKSCGDLNPELARRCREYVEGPDQ